MGTALIIPKLKSAQNVPNKLIDLVFYFHISNQDLTPLWGKNQWKLLWGSSYSIIFFLNNQKKSFGAIILKM